MKIAEKLKELGMSDSDLLSITEAFKAERDSQVALKLEESKKDVEKTLEEVYAKKLEEAVAAERTKLDEEKKAFENDLVEKLDLFLEAEVNEKISDELIEKAAINETLLPLVEGIKSLFEDKYVALDTEGAKVVAESKKNLETKTKELSESIAEKMKLVGELDLANKKLLLAEKSAKLSENQTKRLNEMFENQSFADTKAKIDGFLGLMLEEKKDEKKPGTINENKDLVSSEDKILSEKKNEKSEVKVDAKKKNLIAASELV